MLKGGLICMKEGLATLKPTERKVAEYILSKPDQVVKYSVQRLADEAGVSEATIIRLSRSLNYKGFQELKLRIAGDLVHSEQTPSSYQEIQVGGSTDSLIRSISYNNMRSIEDTLSVLSAEEVEKAIRAMTDARKISLFGVGASAVIAEDFRQKLSRINRWCEAAFGFDGQATLAANMIESDVAFGISYSGLTRDLVESLSIAKANGATIVTLTKFSSNPVSELADIHLFASSLEQSIRSGAMASRIAQLNVIDILYVGIAGSHYEESINSLDRTRKAVQISKRDV